ncbi:hypothetical protein [Cupriavidus pampae]|uniref:Uncharacterized protein n=1 Tax=Cupriavidus pampae TaxID=659251 RepID=A0ABM8XVP6_9BURK|nr:hypothetical protein [Cupriavidus pampae]CAG9184461.1 hypothetical protein LMG32289_05624 [Cupriavidus pampae]
MAEKPATDAQRRMLRDIHLHRDATYSLYGRSAHGGATRTLFSLKERGWILNPRTISAAGCKVLGVEPPAPPSPELLAALAGQPTKVVEAALEAFAVCCVGPRRIKLQDYRPGRLLLHLDETDQIVTRVTVE